MSMENLLLESKQYQLAANNVHICGVIALDKPLCVSIEQWTLTMLTSQK